MALVDSKRSTTTVPKRRNHRNSNIHKGSLTSSSVLIVLGFLCAVFVVLNAYLYSLWQDSSRNVAKEPIAKAVDSFRKPLQDDDDLVRAIVHRKKQRNQVPNQKEEKQGQGPTANAAQNATKIRLLRIEEELDWMRTRTKYFREGVIEQKKIRRFHERTVADPLAISGLSNHYYAMDSGDNLLATRLLYNHSKLLLRSTKGDPSKGPWLDFVIAGNAKCGTTTLMANLRKVAPMPVRDNCVGVAMALKQAYLTWPNDTKATQAVRAHMGDDPSLWLRGNKCPRFLGTNLLLSASRNLPKTKYIIGIRHPVSWFTSFWNMDSTGDGHILANTEMCSCPVDPYTGVRNRTCPEVDPNERCNGPCRCGSFYCLHMARFHLSLARLGKTNLTDDERRWLAPGDDDGGANLVDARVSNPIFLYDLGQMRNDSYWEDLAAFLGISALPNTEYHGSHGKMKTNKTLCLPKFDYFRSRMMGYSYELAHWLQHYLLPVADDPNRSDVVLAGSTNEFHAIVETYKDDPCGRLVRRESDGIYVLRGNPNNSTTAATSYSSSDPIYGAIDTRLPPRCKSRTKR